MKKVLVIAGPTASGKSGFAVEAAKLLNGIVISGDSIQVYRGFDIGSGKVTEEEMQGVPHALIDILDPRDHYSVASFQQMARNIIENDSRFPIICGGTGLYLKACLYDYEFPETAEKSEDAELERYSTEELWVMLRTMDPAQTEKIHPHNRRRIIRSLTILRETGRRQSEIHAAQAHEPLYDMWIAGCTMEREVLHERISRRVDGMFAAGLEKEVENLLGQGCTFADQAMQGIGYREWQPYFEGRCSTEEVREEIKKHSRQFAKRQYTWLRHQMPVHWFNPQDEADRKRMINEIREWSKI